jgi:hypothetical protein
MEIVIWALVFLLIMAVVTGISGSLEITLAIELNLLSSPFYKLGIFYQRYDLDDESMEDELTIGLFFVNVVVTFWKPAD